MKALCLSLKSDKHKAHILNEYLHKYLKNDHKGLIFTSIHKFLHATLTSKLLHDFEIHLSANKLNRNPN